MGGEGAGDRRRRPLQLSLTKLLLSSHLSQVDLLIRRALLGSLGVIVRLRILLAGAALLALAGPASAAWHKASSKHFVIYADKDADELRAYATKLEQFNAAVREGRGSADVPPGASSRVTLFVLPSLKALRKLTDSETIAGFYMPRISGPVAFVPAHKKAGKWDLSSDNIFFHEYTHHLLLQDTDVPMPTWVSEGSAEFFATPRFNEDGSLSLGAPPFYRAEELWSSWGLPLPRILSGEYEYLNSMEAASIYGRGWLLIHYLNFTPSRRGQLPRYLDAISAGIPMPEAATKAFGDIKQLERELGAYFKSKSFTVSTIPAEKLAIPPIEVTALPPAQAELMDARIKLAADAEDHVLGPLARKARGVSDENPGDLEVAVLAAELAIARDEPADALRLARRGMSIDAKSYAPRMALAKAMFHQAAENPAKADWAAVRTELAAANRLDPEAAEPLVLFYRTFEKENARPTANALEGLAYALALAPRNSLLRISLVEALIAANRMPEARAALEPLAYSPHRGKWRDALVKLLEAIDSRDPARSKDSLYAVKKFTRDWAE